MSPGPHIIFPIAVIGTGRSGTGYVSEWLTAAGYEVGHEAWGRDGISSWRATDEDLDRASTVVHVIREPRACAWSWVQPIRPFSIRLVEERLGFDPQREPLRYWLEWNRVCEDAADVTISLHDWDRWAGWVLGRHPKIAHNINARPKTVPMPPIEDEPCFAEAMEYWESLQ